MIQEYITQNLEEDRIRTFESKKSQSSQNGTNRSKSPPHSYKEKSFDYTSQFKRSLKEEAKKSLKDFGPEGNEGLGISSILENSGQNNETDILEYCTPNYATNTSRLFSTKEREFPVPPLSSAKASSEGKIIVEARNMESFSLGPIRSPTNNLTSRQASQKFVEELKSIEDQNAEQESIITDEELSAKDLEVQPNLEQNPSQDLNIENNDQTIETDELLNPHIRGNFQAKYMKDMFDRMQGEKQEIQKLLDQERDKNLDLENVIKDLRSTIGKYH